MSNFPIWLNDEEKKQWREAATRDGFTAVAAFVKSLVRRRISEQRGGTVIRNLSDQEGD